MEFKYTFGAIFFLTMGIIFTIYHNSIGESATRFREKWWGVIYSSETRQFNKIGFLIFGIFAIILGILLLFHKIRLR